MRRRFKKAFDISGIVVLLLVLTVFVWLSSDSHIYFSRNSGYFDKAFTMKMGFKNRNCLIAGLNRCNPAAG